MDSSLAGHWKFDGDLNDSSGNNSHGQGHNISLNDFGPNGAGSAATFDGVTSVVTLPKCKALETGSGDFSICAFIHTEPDVDDPIGDIIGCFDPDTRRGFNLNVKRHSAAPGSLANYRNVHFGIDNEESPPEWKDCGRPGNARFVMALAAHDGSLFAGTYEDGEGETGHLHRLNDGQWEDLGSPDGSNAVMSLAPFQGKLYAGTGRLKGEGSALERSPNDTEGGRVFRWDGEWIDCGGLQGAKRMFPEYRHDTVHAMEVFGGDLYAIPLYTQGLFRYDGEEGWKDCGSPGNRAFAISVFRGQLYMAENSSGVMRFESGKNWTKWTCIVNIPGSTQNYSTAIYQGQLHVGTWPEGRVFRLEENGEWTDTGRLGEEKEVMGMAIYNGKLYAGTLPLAQVYRYDGDGNWTCTGQLDTTPDVKYRRAWSTAVFDGKLYCGTLPCGHVFSLEAGRSATYDHALEPGWQHIAAVRNGDRLELSVNGKQVATSSTFDPATFDLTNERPVKIGFGSHDYFHGRIADVRIYRRALSSTEINSIANLQEFGDS